MSSYIYICSNRIFVGDFKQKGLQQTHLHQSSWSVYFGPDIFPDQLQSHKPFPKLAGGFNPFEKILSQHGNLHQVGVNIKKIFELPPPRNFSEKL